MDWKSTLGIFKWTKSIQATCFWKHFISICLALSWISIQIKNEDWQFEVLTLLLIFQSNATHYYLCQIKRGFCDQGNVLLPNWARSMPRSNRKKKWTIWNSIGPYVKTFYSQPSFSFCNLKSHLRMFGPTNDWKKFYMKKGKKQETNKEDKRS